MATAHWLLCAQRDNGIKQGSSRQSRGALLYIFIHIAQTSARLYATTFARHFIFFAIKPPNQRVLLHIYQLMDGNEEAPPLHNRP